MPKFIFLDIMRGDRFVCTLRYPRPPLYPRSPLDFDKLFEFVYEKRPTFRNAKDLIIYPYENKYYGTKIQSRR